MVCAGRKNKNRVTETGSPPLYELTKSQKKCDVIPLGGKGGGVGDGSRGQGGDL